MVSVFLFCFSLPLRMVWSKTTVVFRCSFPWGRSGVPLPRTPEGPAGGRGPGRCRPRSAGSRAPVATTLSQEVHGIGWGPGSWGHSQAPSAPDSVSPPIPGAGGAWCPGVRLRKGRGLLRLVVAGRGTFSRPGVGLPPLPPRLQPAPVLWRGSKGPRGLSLCATQLLLGLQNHPQPIGRGGK